MTDAVNKWYAEPMGGAEERFHQLLAVLAGQCGTELNEMLIELYDRNLAKHGYEAICRVLESILVERSDRDPFPSIGTIRSRLGVQSTVKDLSMDVTNRISAAISSKGFNWAEKVPNFDADQLRVLGPAGVAVVKRLGGWRAVVEFANRNPSHYLTWIRDSAVGIIAAGGPSMLQLMPAEPMPQLEDKK